MKQLTTAAWEKRLTDANVPHAVVRTYADAFTDEQTLARGMKLTVRDPAGNAVDLIGNPVHLHGAAPAEPTMPLRATGLLWRSIPTICRQCRVL